LGKQRGDGEQASKHDGDGSPCSGNHETNRSTRRANRRRSLLARSHHIVKSPPKIVNAPFRHYRPALPNLLAAPVLWPASSGSLRWRSRRRTDPLFDGSVAGGLPRVLPDPVPRVVYFVAVAGSRKYSRVQKERVDETNR
jgi:hypothetical protein